MASHRLFSDGLLLLALAAGHAAVAGSFGIAPTRVELAAGHRIDVLTVHNQDVGPVQVQVRAFAWSQHDGNDQYEETHEVLVAPPVFELPPQAEQIVRLALRRDPDPARELSYRVVLQEVPQALPAGTSGLKVAVRLAIPVFVAPPQPVHAELVWRAHRLADGRLQIEAANRGGAHVQINQFDLELGDAVAPLPVRIVQYVLPGSEVSWIVTPRVSVSPEAGLQVHGSSDQGAFTAPVTRTGL
jgi:fimbrial chaperone protein